MARVLLYIVDFLLTVCIQRIKTRNTLDCDQSNYSSRIVFSHIPIVLGQTGIKIRRTRKPHIRTKHGVNRTIRRGDIAI